MACLPSCRYPQRGPAGGAGRHTGTFGYAVLETKASPRRTRAHVDCRTQRPRRTCRLRLRRHAGACGQTSGNVRPGRYADHCRRPRQSAGSSFIAGGPSGADHPRPESVLEHGLSAGKKRTPGPLSEASLARRPVERARHQARQKARQVKRRSACIRAAVLI